MDREKTLLWFGNRITERRIECGLQAVELSARTNISAHALSKYENGRSNPSFLNLCELAIGLECPLSYFQPEAVADSAGENGGVSAESWMLAKRIAKLSPEDRHLIRQVVSLRAGTGN